MTTPPLSQPSEASYKPGNPPGYPSTSLPAQRLQAARQRLRWSRQGLADLLGYQHATIFRYETGTRAPPRGLIDWLETIAAELEAALDRSPPPQNPR